jgi:uncharacterized protein with HEPN domain
MPRGGQPRAALEDIAEAIALIERYLRGRKRADLDVDPMLRQAIERNIEIISEASRRLPDAWKTRHPAVPWRKVAGIGNVLRHDYDRVDNTVLWQAATAEVSTLKSAVEAMRRDIGAEEKKT